MFSEMGSAKLLPEFANNALQKNIKNKNKGQSPPQGLKNFRPPCIKQVACAMPSSPNFISSFS